MRFTARCRLVNLFTKLARITVLCQRAADVPSVSRRTRVILGTMPVHVTSEIGRLRAVLVHTPGPELLAVTPSTREDYLYDDIIDVDCAQREHRRFVAMLERFTQVHFVRDLLAEVVTSEQARDLLIRETMDIVPSG